jgi:protein TonB
MPQFNGDLMKYLAAHVNYPELARNAGIAGRVVIEFVVNEDGNVTDARVVRGIGGGCDEEALRVVKAMPAWKAGKQNGRKVKVFYMLPIVFALQ